MKRWKPTWTLFLIACLVAGITAVRTGYSDETKKDAEDKPAAKADAKQEARIRRLPNHYGQVGLSSEQKEKIYAIQAKYRPQIEELQKQIRELRETQRLEAEGVLTSGQKSQLKELVEKARRARQARNRQSASGGSDSEKPKSE